MTRQEAIDELHKHYVPEYANYIVTALTDGATPSDAPTINAIPIPEDATNGDVIKMMFPNFEVKIIGDTVIMETHYPHPFCKMQFDIRYWNTLYKAESEDKNDTTRKDKFGRRITQT